MRCCVTGATGFIGSHLVARLKAQGHWVRAVDLKESALREPLYSQANEVWTGIDLRKSAHLALAGTDLVFHLAADHGGAGYFYSDADWKAARNNLQIDLNVLKALKPAQRLFFASSACTYPTAIQGDGAAPLRESDWGKAPAEQQYGEAKRMSTIVMDGAREHGLDVRCGIFHTIYGPFQEYVEPRAKFPTAICRKIIESMFPAPDFGDSVELPRPKVEVWGDGTQVRTFLYIEDALDRIQTVMDKPHRGPVNVGSDEEVTVQQCCEWAAGAMGVSPEWVYTDGPTGVAHRSADNSEWDRRYGEAPLVSAEEGFGRLAEWLRAEMAVELEAAA